jgi:predicted flap endonuclease-1-like 5' DNA nuclease
MLDLALNIVAWLAAATGLGFCAAWLLRNVSVAELQERVQRLETDLLLREHELGEARRMFEPAARGARAPDPAPDAVPATRAQHVPARPDDLKLIHGVGPVLEQRLHQLGVHSFRQVALWTDADIDYFDQHLQSIRGRIRREDWVRSAAQEHLRQYGESLPTAPWTPAAVEPVHD